MSMAQHDDFSFGDVSRREAVLWSAAAAVIVSVHMAGAWYLHQQPAMTMDEPQGQTAVMIDLAPMALAPEAVPQETSDLVDSRAAESVEPTETITPDPVEPEPTPVEEVAQEVPEPVEEIAESEPVEEVVPDLVEAPLPEVAMAIPEPRPEVEKPKSVAKPVREKKKTEKEPVKQAKVEKKQPANSPAAQKSAQDSETTRAAAAGQGGGRSMSTAQWKAKVLSRIARQKRDATGNGSVQISFTFTAAGEILSASVASSSGNPKLDQIALKMVRRASPIPAPPPSTPLYLVSPITFKAR